MLSEEKLLAAMTNRMELLRGLSQRDFSGGLHNFNEVIREVKWWKEAIERKEFHEDIKEEKG